MIVIPLNSKSLSSQIPGTQVHKIHTQREKQYDFFQIKIQTLLRYFWGFLWHNG